jgi:hypothetical protein
MPHPILFSYMIYGDSLVEGESSSLLDVLRVLGEETKEFAAQVSKDNDSEFERRLADARKQVYYYKGSRKGRRMFVDVDLDDEFLWNCVLLEEVVKELVAVILSQSISGLDSIVYA